MWFWIKSHLRPIVRRIAIDFLASIVVVPVVGFWIAAALIQDSRLIYLSMTTAGVAIGVGAWELRRWCGEKRASRLIMPAPGSIWMSILTILYSKRVRERVFVPVISDMRVEHAEALLAGKPRLARWIHIRGVIILIFTMAFHLVSSAGQAALKIWSASK